MTRTVPYSRGAGRACLVRLRVSNGRLPADGTAVIIEFGTDMPQDVAIRVHDSNANMRYLVVQVRPAGTRRLVGEGTEHVGHRDSLIGVTSAKVP